MLKCPESTFAVYLDYIILTIKLEMNKIVTLLGYIKQFSTNFINKFKRTITTSLLLINALKLDKHDLQYPLRALYFSVGKIDNLH